MAVEYDIRPWGEGFWRWDCRTCQRGLRDSFGVLGQPRQYGDAVQEALDHLAERHPNAPAA